MPELRHPLVPLPELERVNKLRALGLDGNLVPLDASPLEKEAAKMADSPVVVGAPAPVVKSGWKTTEHWALMLLLGGLGYALTVLKDLVPVLVHAPGVPVWVAPIAAVGVPALAWVAHKAVVAYQEQRVALKLPPDVSVDNK